MKKLLVLGIGNTLLTDDGVGVHAAEILWQEEWPENVTVMEAGTFTQDIYAFFEGYDRLLVLDVIHAEHDPGTIYELTEDDIRSNEKQRVSIHDIDMLDSLRMCEMRCGSRPKMEIIGMQPYDITTWNIGLSDACKPKFDNFVAHARKRINEIIVEMN
ncbi:NiFeSe hydrogenase maturation protease [Halodesulfovibrio sp. MK-HDV]|jgi:hydrogenase maturation protease|uniref:NiFeSe hydrogenase maturation protease n=1 Tax=Halodesulfovibrio sp. MK-HDV TaxID=2599925 RepID=UPI00136EA603|nr:NiFeSe hydrogenase maturation protease [Halodesulfovibrio sp. MK-HDV]KAF1077684.1 Hydrogenase 1 maturation protease [Halodesulfovibrio sp. MK-HDV]